MTVGMKDHGQWERPHEWNDGGNQRPRTVGKDHTHHDVIFFISHKRMHSALGSRCTCIVVHDGVAITMRHSLHVTQYDAPRLSASSALTTAMSASHIVIDASCYQSLLCVLRVGVCGRCLCIIESPSESLPCNNITTSTSSSSSYN